MNNLLDDFSTKISYGASMPVLHYNQKLKKLNVSSITRVYQAVNILVDILVNIFILVVKHTKKTHQ